jgi:hypothetical protein
LPIANKKEKEQRTTPITKKQQATSQAKKTRPQWTDCLLFVFLFYICIFLVKSFIAFAKTNHVTAITKIKQFFRTKNKPNHKKRASRKPQAKKRPTDFFF